MKSTYGLQPRDDHRERGDEAPTAPAPAAPTCVVCLQPSDALVCVACLGREADSAARRQRIAAGDLNVCHDVNTTAADVDAVLAARRRGNHSGI